MEKNDETLPKWKKSKEKNNSQFKLKSKSAKCLNHFELNSIRKIILIISI